MFSRLRIAAVLGGFLLLTAVTRPSPEVEAGKVPQDGRQEAVSTHPDFYTVSDYDESRDPALDLVSTVERARSEEKRILLEVGGTWCGWCKLLDAFVQGHSSVSEMLSNGFLIMKVNWSSGNRNEAFLGQYPRIHGYPHIFVLEKDGTFLHSQDTVELEMGRSYSEEAILTFLREWMPEGDSAGGSSSG